MVLPTLTLWSRPSAVFSAVASVSPTSAAGVSTASAVIAETPLQHGAAAGGGHGDDAGAHAVGTVSVSSCWSAVAPVPS